MKLGEPMSDDEMTKVLQQQGAMQDRIDAIDAWNLDQRVEMAMDALRLPPSEAEIATLSGGERRRVALARILLSRPDMLLLGRAHESSRRGVGRVARAFLEGLRGHRRGHHPRPLFLG